MQISICISLTHGLLDSNSGSSALPHFQLHPAYRYASIMLTFILLFLMSCTSFLVSSIPIYFR